MKRYYGSLISGCRKDAGLRKNQEIIFVVPIFKEKLGKK